MGRLFGTDGIRGIFNQEPVTEEMGYKLGRAVVSYFKGMGDRPRIVIGRDTRSSGKILENAIASGILSIRAEPILLGELPTPGVAFVTKDFGADAGIMISASHNPSEYNGFKIFSQEGYKLTDEAELHIEDLILSDLTPTSLKGESDFGQEKDSYDPGEEYLSFLQHTLPEKSAF